MEDHLLARGLYDSYFSSSKQQFSPFTLENGYRFEKTDIVDIIDRLKKAFVVQGHDHWQAIAGLFDILSEKDRIRIIDMVAGNRNGVQISKIEKALEGSTFILMDLIEEGIIEHSTNDLVIQGPNMEKAIICLEILRKVIIIIENKKFIKENEMVSKTLLDLLQKGEIKEFNSYFNFFVRIDDTIIPLQFTNVNPSES